jgi:predicted NodU family carbamoyl transferase
MILDRCCSHNKSAALVKDNKLLHAIEEERLSRIKYSPNLLTEPKLSIDYLLQHQETETYSSNKNIPIDHHLAHAYSCYPLSGFNKASILVMDGMGDDEDFFRSISLYRGEGNTIKLQKAIYMPYSLGSFYTLFTELFFNFGILEDGKTMGLSSYGAPYNNYYKALKEIVYFENGDIKFNKDYFRFVLNESYYLSNKHRLDKFFEKINLDFPIELKKDFLHTYPENHFWTDMNRAHLNKFCFHKKDFETFIHLPCYLSFKENITDFLGIKPRLSQNESFLQEHMDLAWAVQKRLEDAITLLTRQLKSFNPDTDNLAMAGGVALNCVANAKIYGQEIFNQIFVQPAAADSGLSIGSALYNSIQQNNKKIYPLNTAYLGHEYKDEEISHLLEKYTNDQVISISKYVTKTNNYYKRACYFSIGLKNGNSTSYKPSYGKLEENRFYYDIPFSLCKDKTLNYYFDSFDKLLNEPRINTINLHKISYTKSNNTLRETARHLSEGKIVGWFQGAAEFGPRALGHRSILTAPYPAKMKDILNTKVKHRENFRPFAGTVLEEHASDYFHLPECSNGFFKSPYMLFAFKAKDKAIKECPAIIHVDGTCRLQTLAKTQDGGDERFYRLIDEFYKTTKLPILLNTSFNVAGQPIVETPYDALHTFLSTQIDILVLHDYILTKEF